MDVEIQSMSRHGPLELTQDTARMKRREEIKQHRKNTRKINAIEKRQCKKWNAPRETLK